MDRKTLVVSTVSLLAVALFAWTSQASRSDGEFVVPSSAVESRPLSAGRGELATSPARPVNREGAIGAVADELYIVGPQDDSLLPVHVGGRVTIRLRFPDGTSAAEIEALEGAEILFQGRMLLGAETPRRLGIVDREGRIELPALRATTWQPSTHRYSSGAPPQLHRPVKSIEPFYVELPFKFRVGRGVHAEVEIPLEKSRVLEGYVVDANGEGIEGAILRATHRADAWVPAIEATATAGFDGRFVLRGMRGDLQFVDIRASGFESRRIATAAAQELLDRAAPFEIRLNQGRDVAVRCTLPDGRPVQGVSVHAVRDDEGQEPHDGAPFASAETDEDGVARFEGLPSGPFEFRGTATITTRSRPREEVPDRYHAMPFLGGVSRTQRTGRPGVTRDAWLFEGGPTGPGDTSAHLEGERAPLVTGRLEWSEAGRATSAFVHVADSRSRAFVPVIPSARRVRKIHVDLQTRRFECTLPPGEYVAVGVASGAFDGASSSPARDVWIRSERIEFTVGATDRELTVPLAHGQSIEGRLEGPARRILEGTNVVLRGLGDRAGVHSYVECDEEGRFAFDLVPPGRYRITLNGGSQGVVTDVFEGDRIRDLVLPLGPFGGSLEVLVGDLRRDADLWTWVSAICEIDGADVRLRRGEGFDLEAHGLPSGPAKLTVHVSLEGQRFSIVRPVEITEGKATVVDLSRVVTPRATTRIEGRLIAKRLGDRSLKVLLHSGGYVTALGSVFGSGDFTLRTPERGPAELIVATSRPGTPVLLSQLTSHSTIATIPLELAGADVDVGEIELPTGGIELLVDREHDRRGRAPARARALHFELTSTERSEALKRRCSTGEGESRIVVRYLPDGAYRVECVSEGASMDTVFVRVSGGTITENVILRVRGR